jgi:hypothetical protein
MFSPDWLRRRSARPTARPRPAFDKLFALRERLEQLEDRTVPTISWNTNIAPNGGLWSVSGDWIGGVVPGASDDASIPVLGGPVIVNSPASARTLGSFAPISVQSGSLTLGQSGSDASSLSAGLIMSAGTFTATGTVALGGTSSWSGGTLTGAGSISNSGTLTMSLQPTLTTTFNNTGTIDQNGPSVTQFSLNSGGVFNNTATGVFDIQKASSPAVTGSGTFNNAGLLKVSATGPVNSPVGTPFSFSSVLNNSGTVQLLNDSLSLGASGNVHSGSFNVGSGFTLEFIAGGSGSTFNSGTSFSGTGTVRFDGGNTIAGATTIPSNGPTVSFTGGTLTANADLEIDSNTSISGGTISAASGHKVTLGGSASTWTGGSFAGAGTVRNTGTLAITVPLSGLSTGGNFSNAGTITQGEASTAANVGTNGTLTNEAAGSWTLGGVGTGLTASGGSGSGVVNLGTIHTNPTGGGTVHLDASVVGTATFQNSGLLDVQAGAVTVTGSSGSTSTGEYRLAGGTTLTFSAGSHTFGAGASFTGSGTTIFNGASPGYTVTAPVSFAGPVQLNPNTFTANAGLTFSSTLQITGGTLNPAGLPSRSGRGRFSPGPGRVRGRAERFPGPGR